MAIKETTFMGLKLSSPIIVGSSNFFLMLCTPARLRLGSQTSTDMIGLGEIDIVGAMGMKGSSLERLAGKSVGQTWSCVYCSRNSGSSRTDEKA
ncbi:MAG: hypothetical protein ABIJ86_09450 [Spirochaetota bacterium]